MSPAAWKQFYWAERDAMGVRGLSELVDRSPSARVAQNQALIFPHTRLSASGHLIASVAKGIVEAGCETVLALGVLHGMTRDNSQLRGIHGPGAPNDGGIWKDEFSLDSFEYLVSAAAEAAGRRAPRLVMRYPFLVGTDPKSLPGLDELRQLLDDGAALVATADMVHHGAGYGTPTDQQLPRESEATLATARRWISEHLSYLSRRDYAGFLAHADRVKSDFRDAGPVLAELLRGDQPPRFQVEDLVLVDYSDVLQAPPPTWVAAALARLVPMKS